VQKLDLKSVSNVVFSPLSFSNTKSVLPLIKIAKVFHLPVPFSISSMVSLVFFPSNGVDGSRVFFQMSHDFIFEDIIYCRTDPKWYIEYFSITSLHKIILIAHAYRKTITIGSIDNNIYIILWTII